MGRNLTSKELTQFRADCLFDVDTLAQEISDRMIDILVKYQSGDMEGIDAEIMGCIVLNEMNESISGYFMDAVFDLSADLDGEEQEYDDETEDDENDEQSDVTEVDDSCEM